MILTVQLSGALLGFLAVLFGAFGAHALKKRLGPEQVSGFETGVRYQMYHAIVLLILSFNLGFTSALETWIAYCFIVGTVLFSFSIYLIYLISLRGKRSKLLRFLTPVGGLFLMAGWGMLLYSFIADIV